ncbi:divergent polysaccharide deacetylase family protein [Candidatus Sumerlaeota bacterium]|nr:divergent polysaccharide deacetylase family protein [Candidatus Sumerlaeota bacterium]
MLILSVIVVAGDSEAQERFIRFEPSRVYHYVPLTQPTTYQVVLDVEDPSFEILSGNWTLSKSGSYYGYYYFTIDGPGTGAGRARWIAEGLPQGTYSVEFWALYGDFAEDARYEIISADGVTTLSVNMNYIPSGWHLLGTFNINRLCVVNISDYWTGGGTKLSVDALRFTLTSPLPSPPPSPIPPHIGICIDDCGAVDPTQPGTPIYKMLRLPFKMTFAVLPYRSYTNQTAEEIFHRGSEVILHQPMAAISIPDPGPGGITDDMTLAQVREVVATNLDSLPHVTGMNNHMGSLITQQEDKMQVCCEELKARNLFLYDSRTITTSVAYDVAKQNGLLTGERDMFIDGNSKEQAKELIRNLALQALYAPNIPHLAIGHVRSSTADALQEIAPELTAMGVEVWTISRCMAQVIETDFVPDGCSFSTTGTWSLEPNDCLSKQLHDGYSMFVADPSEWRSESALFVPSLPWRGLYDIYAIWNVEPNNAPEIQSIIYHNLGVSTITIDQSQSFNDWFYLGRYLCSAGSSSRVVFNDYLCTLPGKVFRVDAIKYVFAGEVSALNQFWYFF